MSDDDPIEIARSAAENALQFAGLLATRFTGLAEALRNGNDAPALESLGDSTEDLEQFLTFLVLVADMIQERDPETTSGLKVYKRELMKTLESLSPALSELDLVEVADTLEHDVVESLNGYSKYDNAVQTALLAA